VILIYFKVSNGGVILFVSINNNIFVKTKDKKTNVNFFLKKIKIFFIACDYLVISFICYYLSNKYFHFNLIPFRNEHYKYTIFMIVGLWFLISKYTKIYENFFTEDSTIHFRNLSKANLLFIISIGVFIKT
jgi:hypothetical protein